MFVSSDRAPEAHVGGVFARSDCGRRAWRPGRAQVPGLTRGPSPGNAGRPGACPAAASLRVPAPCQIPTAAAPARSSPGAVRTRGHKLWQISAAVVTREQVRSHLAHKTTLARRGGLPRSSQAFVWLNWAAAAGSVGAAAAAGWAVGAYGVHGGFASAATTAGAMAVVATAGLSVCGCLRRVRATSIAVPDLSRLPAACPLRPPSAGDRTRSAPGAPCGCASAASGTRPG